MTIYFATDHAGFALKEVILAYVRDSLGYEVVDCGAHEYNADDDYPEFIKKAGDAVSKGGENARAIIFGGSGQGEAMVANRYSNVRTTVYYGGSREIITLSREHNNANILSIGARFVSEEEAKEVVSLWLNTEFAGDERHVRRIAQIDSI
jgi:ribose 5-phosphate isomerase B